MSVFLVFIYYMVNEILGSAPPETADTFFTDEEKQMIRDYCRKTKVLRILAGQLKNSLIARGKLDPNSTEKDVLQNQRFMKFLIDLVRLNLNDDCEYGTVVYNNTAYTICKDFELSDDKMKPAHWKLKFPDISNAVFGQFVKNRGYLLKKVKTDSENLVKHMNLIKPEKETPTKDAESKESVQGRVNEFMVS